MELIHYGSKEFIRDKFDCIRNEIGFNKPIGGLWTSPVNSNYGWKDWNESENFKECTKENSFIIKLKPNSKILKIDSKEDLENIPFNKCKHLGYKYIDFVEVSKQYDAIWLTEKGEIETRYLGMYDKDIIRTYGWDCESVLILSPECIESKG